MILEHAIFTIQPGKEEQFEAVFPAAIKVLASSQGYITHELQRSIEAPNRYSLFVQWEKLEDHMQTFRGSDLFTQWRGYVGPFFAAAPVVEHWRLLTGNRR
jgi:heme-degrading monooxygenase HmoA